MFCKTSLTTTEILTVQLRPRFKLKIDRKLFAIPAFDEAYFGKGQVSSDMLQKPTNNLTDATGFIGTLKEEIAECRSREKCQEFWDTAEDVADRLSLPETVSEDRKRRK